MGVLCAVNGADVVRAIIEAPLLNDSRYTNLYSSRGKLILSSGTALADGGQPQELAGLAGLSEKERAAVEEALEQNSSVHFNYKAGNTGMLAVLEPVSYTHLDVYKRQSAIRLGYSVQSPRTTP